MRFLVAQVDRAGQHIDLRAAIVDVVLARHVVAREIQQAGQRIAKDGAAGVTHVQRPRRVRRDVFHVHPLACPQGGAAEVRAGLKNGLGHILPDRRGQPQVQKAGTGHFRRGDACVFCQPRGERLGNVTGLHLGGFRQHHRGVRRHVAMGRVARRFCGDRVEVQPLGQIARADHVGQRRNDGVADIGKDVHHSVPSFPPPLSRRRGQSIDPDDRSGPRPRVCRKAARVRHRRSGRSSRRCSR